MTRKAFSFVCIFLSVCIISFSRPAKKVANIQRPRNVILLIGDGMGLSQISAGLYAKGRLAFERFRHIGLIKTYSADNLITDSAAGATAFSCGVKTYNGAVGLDANKKPCKTILETAEEKGLATGLVVTCSFTHATPAAFFAHQPSRSMDEEIAYDLLHTPIEVIVGGGRKFLSQRTDRKNLIDSLRARNYDIVTTSDAFARSTADKIIYLTADEHPVKLLDGRERYLASATEIAIKKLSRNNKGFFLMIEGSQIDWGGHANDSDYVISEMIEFDDAVKAALNFAEKDKHTLVIVTADHETGGYAIVDGHLMERKVIGQFLTDDHTGTLVPVFAYGPGAEWFGGIYENTDIYHKLKHLMDMK